MTQPIVDRIRRFLREREISFREVHHEPTATSEESARARGEPLRIGGKALLLKCDGEFRLFVVPADRKIDSNSIRRHLRLRKLRFASREELAELTKPVDGIGLVPGAVPPFGEPISPFALYVDEAIRENDRIAFNAGSLTDSIVLGIDDYLDAARPAEIFSFSSVGA